mmetsp:Transcript_24079/g.41240  ORF Transcript_24079/g.41240 Transcript_24079/m.41240 type:complete len:87 (+) Transcript_24079:41-301(+)
MIAIHSTEDLHLRFRDKDLPWTPNIEKALGDLAVESVQEITMITPEEWSTLFSEEKLLNNKTPRGFTHTFAMNPPMQKCLLLPQLQ